MCPTAAENIGAGTQAKARIRPVLLVETDDRDVDEITQVRRLTRESPRARDNPLPVTLAVSARYSGILPTEGDS